MATTLTDRVTAASLSTSVPIAAYGFTGLGVLASANEAELASAATTDLLGSDAVFNRITGTATISSFGSAPNRFKLVRFTGAATLTHNAVSLILPGAANIVAVANDAAIVISDDVGNARVVAYQRAGGEALNGLARSSYDPAGISEQLVGLTATQALSNKTLSSAVLDGGVSGTAVKDEDDMSSDSATALSTQQAIKAYVDALLTTENQALTGGATVTSKNLGTQSSGTLTLDMGDRPLQHATNNGAHTLAPGTVKGSCLVDIVNGASAGAITTSGWTKVAGDSFDTTNGNKFRCHCSVGEQGSLLIVQAMQ